ncbi:MAG: class I SAM-dependent methyltransferase [Ktedonobacterales bacterium]
MIDRDALAAAHPPGRPPPRVLDAACGTGLLLRRLRDALPRAELYGVEASEEMLAQARSALPPGENVQLIRATIGAGPRADLPFAPRTFDLVTCANALHYFPDPVATLAGLAELLASGGQLVLVDFARRAPPFPWPLFEWLVRRFDAGHLRAYTLAQARELCQSAGLRVEAERTFTINWLWHGWGLRASTAS